MFESEILRFMARRDYSPVKLSALAKTLGVSDEDFPEFKAAFTELRQKGRVVIGSKNLIMLPQMDEYCRQIQLRAYFLNRQFSFV